jgi:choline kinase
MQPDQLPKHREQSSTSARTAGVQAVILAAGRGSRLGTYTKQRPKCLVEVDERPLIEHQIELLTQAGVDEICVVVGYRQEAIRAMVGDRAHYIENTAWDETNSLY